MTAGLLLLSACNTKSDEPVKMDFVSNENFFMLQSDTLPQHVDLTQNIEGLNYQNLRLLRSYVYAVHAHWFMEGDLNRFFAHHTSWYEDLCWREIEEKPYEEGIDPKECDRIKAYAEALWQNYPHAYDLIPLSDEEKAFIAKIDQRMKKLMESKEYAGEDDAILLNPNLMVNWFQISDPDPELEKRLCLSNVAFGETQCEQLFNIYEENDYHMMPNFITTDLLLQAYHMYFNYILATLERHELSGKMTAVYQGLIEGARLATKDENQKQMSLKTQAFAAVGLKLLGIEVSIPAEASALAEAELKLIGKETDYLSPLFETETDFAYSLFRPRGRYTRTEADGRYFRSMMWLQKGCFFREKPEQLQWAIYLAQLINQMPAEKQTALKQLNSTITFMMGEPDNLSIIELTGYIKGKDMAQALSDETLADVDEWVKKGLQGRNRIAPKVEVGPQDQLNIMPQRYELDNRILARLFDEKVNAERAYPKGLDVMSVLGVRSAETILDTCYHSAQVWSDYQTEHDKLEKELKGEQNWKSTFYNKWLEDLIVLQKQDKNQPGFMQTSTWQKKNLNTALASWALLKHDAILYAEQPFGAECGGGGLPDPEVVGYVEPNVLFWMKLQETLKINLDVLKKNGLLTEDLEEKGTRLKEMVDFCERIAEQEINGEMIAQEDFNTIRAMGASMEYFTLSVLDPDQTIYEWSNVKGADRCVAQVADVFTRNILGCEKDGILYEASGYPNEMYVVVEINGQCYLTRGATYSYHEFVRPLSEPRMTDEEWQKKLGDGELSGVPEWFAPLLLNKKVVADERYVYSTGC